MISNWEYGGLLYQQRIRLLIQPQSLLLYLAAAGLRNKSFIVKVMPSCQLLHRSE